jgi:hypothetical protein
MDVEGGGGTKICSFSEHNKYKLISKTYLKKCN